MDFRKIKFVFIYIYFGFIDNSVFLKKILDPTKKDFSHV